MFLSVSVGGDALASGPVANSAFNLQGGVGAWQLQEGEQVFRADLESLSYRDVDNSNRGNFDARVGLDIGITDRIQIGGTLPFRTRFSDFASYGRHLRGDLRLLLNSDGQEATSLAVWGTAVEQDSQRVNSGASEMGGVFNWSRREDTNDFHFGIGSERVDYPETRDRFESENRYFLRAGLVDRMSSEHDLMLELELGRSFSGERRTMMFMPGMRWYQPNTELVWTGRIGLAPEAVTGRPGFTARIGVSYLVGAPSGGSDPRIDELEERVDDNDRRITNLEEWVSRQSNGEEPEPDEPEIFRVIIQDTMGDEDRARAWGDRIEEWGNYRFERTEYHEVEEQPDTSTIYYGPDAADAAVELGRNIPSGNQEVLRNEAIE
ncbi:MAG: LytR C-terminal domain-containing protein, partial [Pseudomonadota bacterium]